MTVLMNLKRETKIEVIKTSNGTYLLQLHEAGSAVSFGFNDADALALFCDTVKAEVQLVEATEAEMNKKIRESTAEFIGLAGKTLEGNG